VAILFTQTIDFDNQQLQGVASPSSPTDAANKQYVDNVAAGMDWKASVRSASTTNITLTAPGATIDGVTMVAGDRFLAKNQTNGAENGIYVWTGAASAATRAPDAVSDANVTPGLTVSVEEGSVNGDRAFILVTDAPITVGTTALAFSPLSVGGTSYTAGNGLTLTGTAFSVTPNTGILVSGSGVAVDPSVVVRKFAANVGDGASTSINVTHGLGTRDVVVQLYTNGTPWDTVFCEVQRPDVNTATLVFGAAPASSAYRVVVTG
jgi:hypothetical protein